MTTATTSRHLPTPSISSNPNIQAGRALHLGQGMRGEATTWKVTLCIRAKRKNPTGASVGTGHVSGASLQGGTGDTQEAEAEPTAAALTGAPCLGTRPSCTPYQYGVQTCGKSPFPAPPPRLWLSGCCVAGGTLSPLPTGSCPSSHSHPPQTQPHTLRDQGQLCPPWANPPCPS